MKRKFVIIKHPENSGKYLFRVPETAILNAGDQVMCDTSHGKDQIGVCCCDSFFAEPEVVCKLFGTHPGNLRFVTGRVECTRFIMTEDEENAESE